MRALYRRLARMTGSVHSEMLLGAGVPEAELMKGSSAGCSHVCWDCD
jgi:hypothetical protein